MTPENKKQVLDLLNIRAEYESFGLKVIGAAPNEKGWISCQAIGREDKMPSAGINLDANSKHYGYYNDFGTQDSDTIISFFDACVKFGNDSSAQDAFWRLAEQTGIIIKEDKNKDQWFTPLNIETDEPVNFVLQKPPCTIEGFLAAGGQKGFVPGQGNVIIFPIYDANLTIQGGATFNIYGGLLHGSKNLMIRGTTAGLMGLHGLGLIKAGTAKTVYMVEGIPDMVALQSKIPAEKWNSVAVITHSGGAGAHLKTHMVKFFAGLDVIIIPDADKPGIAGGSKHAAALAKYVNSIRIVELPYEITETNGKDLRDWLNEGHTFADLEKLVEDTKFWTENSGLPSTEEFVKKLLDDLQVNIFGQDEFQNISGFSLLLKRWFSIKDRNRYTFLNLIGDCGEIVRSKVTQSQKDVPEGMYSFKRVVEAFCWEAAKNNIRNNDRCGQGIWLDPQTQDAVVVIGNGQAAVWNGTTLERLSKPFHGKLQLNSQASPTEFVDFDTLKEALENYDEKKAPVAFAELQDLLTQWNWNSDMETTVTLIAALATASFIQSTFSFRPQMCIVGESNSGKSSVLNKLLGTMFGELAKERLKPTEAAIRQLAEKNSNILLIDELEKDKHRESILKLLRTSTDGGIVSKGQPNGKEQQFGLKHIVWISSIEMNLANLADASRFFQVEPTRPTREDGKRAVLKLDSTIIKKIGFDLMVFAIKNMKSLLQSVKELSEVDIVEALPRHIEAAAVPAAVAEKLCGWTRRQTEVFMFGIIHDNNPKNSMTVTEDHHDLLQAILTQIIRVADEGELSIAQTIRKYAESQSPVNRTNAREALERYDIKIVKHQLNDMVLFNVASRYPAFIKNLPDWKGISVKMLLKRLPDTKEIRAKFNGQPVYAIAMPIKNTTHIGYDEDEDNNDSPF